MGVLMCVYYSNCIAIMSNIYDRTCTNMLYVTYIRLGSARPEVRGTAELHGGAYPP